MSYPAVARLRETKNRGNKTSETAASTAAEKERKRKRERKPLVRIDDTAVMGSVFWDTRAFARGKYRRILKVHSGGAHYFVGI
jgi:hypothetical protein